MSTEQELPNNEFEKLVKTSPPTVLDDTAAILEARLQKSIDENKEERCIWILICTIMFNVISFPHLSWGMVPVFLLELVLLVFIATKCGVEIVVVLLNRIFDGYLSRNRQKDG